MKIIAFTGAGISKAAGIPTFEEVKGLKDKLSIDYKNANPEEFEKIKNSIITNMKGKNPTKAHKILAKHNVPIITMNIDNLHRKAGSKIVYELHGNYIADNIVLYGQSMHHAQDATTLILKTAQDAKKSNEDAYLLVIGTSMQTAFANILVWLAENRGMTIVYINNNADTEVEKFFKNM